VGGGDGGVGGGGGVAAPQHSDCSDYTCR